MLWLCCALVLLLWRKCCGGVTQRLGHSDNKMAGLIIPMRVYVRATVITDISYLNKTFLTGRSVDMRIGLTAWPVDRPTGK